MHRKYKSKIKTWGIYFATFITAILVHELGHCVVAWWHGLKAVPTPAKAYLPESISSQLVNAFSLGGVLGTVGFSLAIISLFIVRKFNFDSSVFAGAMASPGLHSLFFLLKGRGHDATEFQEAQAALGQSYSGHFLDWLFVIILIVGTLVWIIGTKPSYKLIPKIALGVILSVVFISVFQDLNNRIFDPIFSR
jgi:hypothetical protein